ncbi:MAG TPA: PEP-CTERM sorting domain-containing protein [Fimbriimonadaceae bacterium]|nr:PEP-CTERM sorting domain-containing protein [Fimbriimonadaceae bacterium]
MVFLIGQASAQVIVIDEFRDPFPTLTLTSSNPNGMSGNTQTGLNWAIGGARSYLFGLNTNTVPNDDVIVLRSVADEFLDYSSTAGARATVLIEYGSGAGGPNLGLDLRNQVLTFHFAFLDPGISLTRLSIVPFQGSSGPSLSQEIIGGGLNQTVSFTFAPNANVGATSRLRWQLQGGFGADWRLDRITVQPVPEPATAVALAFGVVGILRRRLRKIELRH